MSVIAIKTLLFSVLREKIGAEQVTVRLPTPATGADLLDALSEAHPQLVPYRQVIRLAVNEAYAEADVPLQEGDEVALITPVSGG